MEMNTTLSKMDGFLVFFPPESSSKRTQATVFLVL